MKICFCTVLIAVLLCSGGFASAAETSMAVQAFGCNLKDGKGQDDFWEAVDQYRETMDGMDGPGLDAINVYALMPFRAAADVDFLWLVASPNLNEMGRGLATYYSSESGQAADAKFAEISDCESGIVLVDEVHAGEESEVNYEDRAPDGVFEMFGCSLLPGKTHQDNQEAVAFWQEKMKKIRSEALDSYSAWLWTPFRTSGRFDFVWLGVNPDIETMMQGATDYLTSEQGQAADQRFASMSRCSSGVWNGYAIFGRNTDRF